MGKDTLTYSSKSKKANAATDVQTSVKKQAITEYWKCRENRLAAGCELSDIAKFKYKGYFL